MPKFCGQGDGRNLKNPRPSVCCASSSAYMLCVIRILSQRISSGKQGRMHCVRTCCKMQRRDGVNQMQNSIPVYYICQVSHCCLLTGVSVGYLTGCSENMQLAPIHEFSGWVRKSIVRASIFKEGMYVGMGG